VSAVAWASLRSPRSRVWQAWAADLSEHLLKAGEVVGVAARVKVEHQRLARCQQTSGWLAVGMGRTGGADKAIKRRFGTGVLNWWVSGSG
jgi:hypothetical protein